MTVVDRERYRVYEQPEWRDITGDALRPGGLALTQHGLALCMLPAGARVLDVGCGEGASVQCAIAEHHFAAVGVDSSAELLRRGRRRAPGLPMLRAAAEQLPVADLSVDAILAECSLSVMVDQGRALAEFQRVLRPDGYLIASDVYARNPAGIAALRRLPIDTCLSGALSQQQIADLLEAHHFRIVVWEDHSAALKPLAARMDLVCGSPVGLGDRAAQIDPFDIQLAVARARPGYYLLVARQAL